MRGYNPVALLRYELFRDIDNSVIGQEIDLADLEKMLESDQRQEAMNGAFQSFGESGQGAPPQEK